MLTITCVKRLSCALVAIAVVALSGCLTDPPSKDETRLPDVTTDTGGGNIDTKLSDNDAVVDVVADTGPADSGTADSGPADSGSADSGPVDTYVPECTAAKDCTKLKPAACQQAACEAGKCVLKNAKDGAACDDGDKCTGTDGCKAGKCAGGDAVKCADDGEFCTDDTCDKVKGCVHPPKAATPCDDGNTCTSDDACDGKGKCAGNDKQKNGEPWCPCTTKNDPLCDKLEDGNKCNGTAYFCDMAQLPYACTLDVSTVVTCAVPGGKDAGCLLAQCSKATGKCSFIEDNKGGACEDGDKCTAGDKCNNGGICVPGAKIDATKLTKDGGCNDGKACTKDSCDPAKGCVNDAKAMDKLACDDGNKCSSGDVCAAGKCAGKAVVCDDKNVCTDDSCDVKVGCKYSNNTKACDDGNKCSGTKAKPDVCKAGKCVAGLGVTCNDGDACTKDACKNTTGCFSTKVVCDDGNPCTTDGCDKAKGCTKVNVKDGTVCTVGGKKDVCKAGVCGAGEDYDHDGLTGTADVCPTVWNPDGDKGACGEWKGSGWGPSSSLALTEPGQKAGMSKVRRTNEPVEVPLVNGIRDASLVGYWPLDGDFKPAFGEGIATNKIVASPKPTDSPLVSGKGMAFDGKADVAHLGQGRAFRFQARMAVSVWLRQPSKSNTDDAVLSWSTGDKCKDHTVSGGSGAYLALDKNGKPRFSITASASSHPAVTGATAVDDGKWHHLAIVRDGARLTMYQDGRLSSSTTHAGLPPSSDCGNWISLGSAWHFSDKKYYKFARVDVDDLALFNRALSSAEIATYYASKAPYGSSSTPGAQLDFDDLRVTEATNLQAGTHATHFEVVGARPHSDSDLKDLVAYWKLDGDAKDVLGKHNGNSSGTKPAIGRFGKTDGALELANDGAGVTVADSKELHLPVGTVEAWARPMLCASSTQLLVSKSDDKTSERLNVGISGSGAGCRWLFTIGGGAAQVTIMSKEKAALEAWSHVAATWDGKQATLSVDGVLVAEAATSGKVALPGVPVRLATYPAKEHQFKGSIDEVLIHKVAKSPDYFAKRARGLPRVRFLAHTRAKAEAGGGFKSHDYKLWWGNKAAKAVGTKVVALDKQTKCDALLSPCLGYAGWWRFDDAFPTLIDSSSRRWHGTSKDSVAPAAGAHGQSLLLSGGYGVVPDAAHLDLTQYTLAASVLPSKAAKGVALVTKELGDGKLNDAWQLHVHTDGSLYGSTNTDKASLLAKSKTGLKVATWTRAAMVASADSLSLWRNGALDATTKMSGTPLVNALPMHFGGYSFGAKGIKGAFHGAIDEIRLMKRVVAADELLHFPLLNAAQKWSAPPKPPTVESCSSAGGAVIKLPSVAMGKKLTVEMWVQYTAAVRSSAGNLLWRAWSHDPACKGDIGSLSLSGGKLIAHAKPHSPTLSTSAPSADQWHHIALQFDTDKLKLFVDGKLATKITTSLGTLSCRSWLNTSNKHLGGGAAPTGVLFDAVRISNIARYPETGFNPGVLGADADTLVAVSFSEGAGTKSTNEAGSGTAELGPGGKWSKTCAIGVAPPQIDYDHDGLKGAADKCPTVWNPDGDAKRGATSCPEWEGSGWSSSSSLSLTEPGQKAGMSKMRRTNEPVEIPLVNGIKDASLKGHWVLNGDLKDGVTGAAGVKNGDPKFVTGPFGPTSKALWFDGKDDYVVAAANRTWRLGAQLTVSAWVKTEGDGAPVSTYSGAKCHDGGLDISFWAAGTPKNSVFHGVYTQGGGKQWKFGAGYPQDGGWHHVAITRVGSWFYTYVDGRLAASKEYASQSDKRDCGNPISLGAFWHGKDKKVAGAWKGAVADVAVFTRALSPAEIATYHASKAPYGSTYVPGAQADFDDVRVTEKTDVQSGEHETHFEVVGARPHSDTDLANVVGYWRFDGAASSVLSGGKAAALKSVSYATGRFGDDKGAVVLDKTSSASIEVPSLDGATGLTVELWLNPATTMDAKSGRHELLYGEGKLLLNYGEGAGQLRLELRSKDGNGPCRIVTTAAKPLAAGVWSHIAATWGAGGFKVYQDGVAVSGNVSCDKGKMSSLAKVTSMLVGRHPSNGVARTHGAFDEVVIHNVAKSADYIAKRARGLPRVRFLAHTRAKAEAGGGFKSHDYRLHWRNNAAKAVGTKVVGLDKQTTCDALLSPCLGYDGWWRFDEGAGEVITDSAWHRRLGDINSAPVWTVGQQGTALLLDGKDDYIEIRQPPKPLAIGDEATVEASTIRDPKDYGTFGTFFSFSNFFKGIAGNNPNLQFEFTSGQSPGGTDSTALYFSAVGGLGGGHLAATGGCGKAAGWCRNGGALKLGNYVPGLFADGVALADKWYTKIKPNGKAEPGVKLLFGSVIGYISQRAYHGKLDEIRLMRRKLSADELLHFPLLTHGLKAKAPVKPGSCNDGNVCTVDIAVPGGGCGTKPATSVACSLGGKTGVCAAGVCKAGGACPLFIKTLTTTNKANAYRVVASDNAVLLIGAEDTAANGRQARLWNIDAQGKTTWQMAYGGSGKDDARDAAATSNGWVVAGATASKGAGSTDAWLFEVNETGKLVWDATYGGKGAEHFESVVALGDGFAAAGATDSKGAGLTDAWIVRTNAAGKTVWDKTYGGNGTGIKGNGHDNAGDILAVPGGFVFAGSTHSKGAGSSDMWLVRLDESGGVKWERTYGGVKTEYSEQVISLNDGGFALVGSTLSKGAGLWDIQLLRLSADGTTMWDRTYGTGGYDYGRGVTQLGDGFALTAFTGPSGNRKLQVLRVDGAGKQVWKRDDSGLNIGEVRAAAKTPTGLAVTGWVKGDKPFLVRMDAWGNTDCTKSGLCAFAKNACDDDDPCTTDSCDAKKGCVHTKIAKCGAPAGWDQDHDGLPDANDKCPTVWSPDDDSARGTSSCAPFSGKGWSSSSSAGLHQPGLKAPWSAMRRTNEPVELPLVNGILDSSVVGYWKLDGDGKDASGNGLHATAKNVPKSSAGAFGGKTGAFSFDGKSSYFDTPWKLQATTKGAFSVAAWVNRDHANADGTVSNVFGHDSGSKSQNKTSVRLSIRASGECEFSLRVKENPKWGAAVKCDTKLVDGRWQHVAATFENQSMSVYLNGRLAGSAPFPFTGTFDSEVSALIGASDDTTSSNANIQGFFAGRIDDVLVFNRALSPSEIATYAGSKAPYGSSFVSGAQGDFDDVRVTENSDVQPWDHATHAEIIGARPHSDTDLANVVAYWRFDGDAKDVIGKHHGTLAGTHSVRGRFGDTDGAVRSGRVNTPYVPKFPAGAPFTAEAWIQPTDMVKADIAMVFGAEKKGADHFTLFVSKTGITADIASSDAKHAKVSAAGAFNDEQWHHVAMVRDTASKRFLLYVDGILRASTTDGTGNIHTTTKQLLYIGINHKSGTTEHQFRGTIDEVIIHNVARSADYIAKRAIGLPRVRFLAHTRSYKSTGGAWKFHDYKLWWGNKAAKALPTKVIGLDKKTACDALLSPCLGYAGWWRFDAFGGTVAQDTSSLRRAVSYLPASKSALHGPGGHNTGVQLDGSGSFALLDFGKNAVRTGELWARPSKVAKALLLDIPGSLSIAYAPEPGTHWSGHAHGPWLKGSTKAAAGLAQHMALVTTGNTATLFVDGQQSATDKAKPDNAKVGAGRIGATTSGATGFVGALDEVRLMNRALRADELLHFPLATHGLKAPPQDMAFIPAGPFWMGCNAAVDKQCAASEKPQHKVELPAYWIDVHPTTVVQYKACVDAKACSLPCTSKHANCGGDHKASINWGVKGRENHPINGVSQQHAFDYCKWRGKRLLTEAEWEKAARGGCEKYSGNDCKTAMPKYPWGNTEPTCKHASLNLKHPDKKGWGCGTGLTSPIGSHPDGVSPYGVHDMGGNAHQWVAGCFEADRYTKSPGAKPKVQVCLTAKYVNSRGGSYGYGAIGSRSSNRTGADRDYASAGYTIRCARDAK